MEIQGPINDPRPVNQDLSRVKQQQQRLDGPNNLVGPNGISLSPEIVRLKVELGHVPEVRMDRVKEVTEQFERGFYLTKTAADATASAILEF